ncbi:hypothetical protein [Halomarina rubra]|uniref:Chromo domain-containing protein n=1 Tax=Halomarina rubra TaxID=2071873 RepID=A0ABD6AXH5_9EURY|nr:hypothetical protein [Halomarina rubra]
MGRPPCSSTPPDPPDLPSYVVDPLDRQSPDRLDEIAEYAASLATWKRRREHTDASDRRAAEAVGEEELGVLSERGTSTDPADYEDVPSNGAYVTVKTTKRSDGKRYRYYYWQWREGETWNNEYIGPVEDSSSDEG